MSKMQAAGGIVGALGLAGLLVFGAFSGQANHAPQPVPTVAAAVTPYVAHVEGPAFDPRPTAGPVAVAAAPVTVAPAPTADPTPAPSGLPSGSVPPNVSGTDQPDSTACASSALVFNGTQSVCA